jgi:peptide/nickel transport system substrate-binding protein
LTQHRHGRFGRRARILALIPVFALAAAACGSSDDDSSSDEPADAAEPAADDSAGDDAAADEPAADEPAADDSGSDDAAADEPAADEPAADDSDSSMGGELVIALPTQPNALDFVNSAERNAANVAAQIFDTLIWVNDDLELEPSLAESWEISEDGKTYTFKLRQGVTFHNGEPFNADSVVFTWEAGSNPENQYATYYQRADSVTAIDEFTVEVTTADVDALFLPLMATAWTPFPPVYYAEVGLTGFSQAPVGTGPFMLTEWEQGDRIVLDRFPDYWRDGYPKLDRITFRPITESSTRAAAIQTGEVDIVNRLSPDEAASLEGIDGVNLVEYPNNRVYYIAFNNLTSGVGEPTEDVRVRQAFNLAVDTQGIIGALFAGKGEPATGLITSGDLGFDASIEPYGYDPEAAKALLAEAGFPDGFDMDMACPSGAYTNFEEVCEAVAAQLGEIGVNISLDIQESGAYWDLEAAKQLPPLFGDSWSSGGIDSYQRLFGALGGDEASFSAWSEPTTDDLLAEMLITVDPEARAELYTQIHNYMFDNPPFIYLYSPISFEAISDKVVNYKPRSAEDFYLWDLEASG